MSIPRSIKSFAASDYYFTFVLTFCQRHCFNVYKYGFTGVSTPASKQTKGSDSVFVTPKRAAPSDKSKEGSSSKPLHKTFLSKSQDNLASQLRRKAVAAALSQKGKEKENTGILGYVLLLWKGFRGHKSFLWGH